MSAYARPRAGGSKLVSGKGSDSSTVTAQPISLALDAISDPIKPAPTIKTSPERLISSRRAGTSDTVRKVWKAGAPPSCAAVPVRSEEHTSELQSRFDLVCRLLLEKKNNHLLTIPHDAI